MEAKTILAAALICALTFSATIARAADPLPSWNDGAAKKSITAFVEKVTKSGSPDFVPVAERIATFDNDGTLWSEQPMYFQAFFIFDRIKALAPQHPEWSDNDDKEGKPVGIQRHIGRRPIAAFGNSDGDFQMLEWTTAVKGPRLGMIVHHDDAEREFAYDRESHVGKLAKGLDEAPKRGWTVIGMKNDWNRLAPESAE